ncbi:MAG TPA: ABC transporter permease [Thermoplasmata archaeon]|nr:ABC transporter permease [Thermoplasmata archaeon]HUJ78284.1 ABC transporter permease [Thermoplasmata archaeon]
MAAPTLARLVYRNVRVNADPATLIILLGLPAMYLIFFGYGFSSLASSGGSGTGYLAFLAPGIMAFQSVMAGTVAGSILWADRRWGMLAQLLVGPFSRVEYLLGIIVTSALFGLGGAVLMLALAVGLLGTTTLTTVGVASMLGAIALGSVLFGGLMLLLAALVKSNNAYNSLQILLIFVVNFASTVFYPLSSGLPIGLKAMFVANPLTYIADAVRHGYAGGFQASDALGFLLLAVETVVLLVLATRAYLRSDVSME